MRKTDRQPDTDELEEGRPRVTDRRRINIDGTPNADVGDEQTAESEARRAPGAEMEERARAAEAKLIEVQQRFDQMRGQMQREADETRQRLARSADERVQNEKASFLRSLLPVLDNLQLAIDAAERGTPIEGLLDGLRGTGSGFESALATVGVESVPGEGSAFDPELHEAVDVKETDAAADGKVTAVYGRGYRIGNRLLRPARVQVGRASGEAAQSGG